MDRNQGILVACCPPLLRRFLHIKIKSSFIDEIKKTESTQGRTYRKPSQMIHFTHKVFVEPTATLKSYLKWFPRDFMTSWSSMTRIAPPKDNLNLVMENLPFVQIRRQAVIHAKGAPTNKISKCKISQQKLGHVAHSGVEHDNPNHSQVPYKKWTRFLYYFCQAFCYYSGGTEGGVQKGLNCCSLK